MTKRLYFGFALFLFVRLTHAAVQPSDSAAKKATAQAPAAKTSAEKTVSKSLLSTVRVVDVYNLATKRRDTLQVGDQVVLRVVNLREALRYYKRKPSELRLFVDNVWFPMEPEQVDTLHSRDTAMVRFELLRNATTEPTWQLFYRVLSKLDHRAHIGVGFESGQLGDAYPEKKNIYLVLVRRTEFLVGLALVGIFLWALIYLAKRTNLVRSDYIRGSMNNKDANSMDLISVDYETVPYSLSKVQLTFWTFFILSGFLLCYLVTGELPNLPLSLLGLLGISLGSNIFSRSITSDQVAVPNQAPYPSDRSQGFWRDILAEQNRISIARIQFLLFNVLLGIFFVRHVWRLWNLPPFDDGQLALISISTAGFLVGKTQENKPPGGTGGGGIPKPDPTAGGATVTVQHNPPGGPTTVVNVGTSPDKSTGTTQSAPNTPPVVQPDGTPTSRADEDDNSAPAPAAISADVPSANLGLG